MLQLTIAILSNGATLVPGVARSLVKKIEETEWSGYVRLTYECNLPVPDYFIMYNYVV